MAFRMQENQKKSGCRMIALRNLLPRRWCADKIAANPEVVRENLVE